MTPVLLHRLRLETLLLTYLFNHTTQLALSTATNQSIHIYGYKNILLLCNNISFPIRFYVCDVKAPLLGLHDIFDSKVSLHINGKDCSPIEHPGETEPLYHHRSHLFIDAMAFDIDHKIHQHWVHYIQQHGRDSERCILMNDIEDPVGEAERPQSLRSPVPPPQSEIDARSLTRQPFHSWCRACERPRRPTSPATSGGERQRHTARLQLHARSCASTTFSQTTKLRHPYSHRVYDLIPYRSACLKEGLRFTSSSTATSLDREAWL